MTRSAPASLSIYRGQSRKGIGEGPGSPISHGEQYLGASPPLDRDADLLEAIRPWMSLDSDPADHQRLGDRLEAWSLFQHRDRQFVVRLVSAGTYDRRAAYFAHGRAWPLDVGTGLDPGLCLGISDAFESPWRDGDSGRRVEEPVPVFRPDRIAVEPERAARLLAHLLQCGARRRPLIIAAPVSEFAAGASLPALVSFARGALPADLRKDRRVRLYTHTPELFLRNLGANLVAVPEELAGQALKVRRDATLVDHQGKLLAGEPLEPIARSYAEAVIERALRIPMGLTAFGERFRDRRSRPGLPEERDVRAIQVTYNLAVALAGSAEERGDLLRSYLPRAAKKLGPEADWKQLIAPDEWRAFPQESILDLLLLDSVALSPGERGLQQAVESSAAQLGLTADSRLPDWWDPSEPAKLRRLLELAAHQPPLISSPAIIERTEFLPIRHIAATGEAAAILEAELRQGSLCRRAAESAELAELAISPEIFRILLRAVERGVLKPLWAGVFLERSPDSRVVAAAAELLQAPSLFQADGPWEEVSILLLDRLRSLPTVPKELAPLIVKTGLGLDPASNLPAYLGLAELVARIDEEDSCQGENVLVARLWREIPASLESQDRELLVNVALSPEWRCLQPRFFAQQGQLRLDWLETMASHLVLREDLLGDLNVPSLLQLANRLERREELERIFKFVNLHVGREIRSSVDTLIHSGWWTGWREMSRLLIDNPEMKRRTAEVWLTSHAWTRKKEATLEDWGQALEDLPQDLDAAGIDTLWRGEMNPCRLWPWIPPFEGEQLASLAKRGSDLIALAKLVEAVLSDPSPPDLGEPPHRYVLRYSRFAHELHKDALGWLLPPDTRGKIDVLDLASSYRLWRSAGPRADRAFEARLQAILDCLKKDSNVQEAISAADEPDLWNSRELLAGVAIWMVERGSLQRIGRDLLLHIESHIDGEPARLPKSVPGSLVRELTNSDFKKAARLLSPEMSRAVEKESLVQSVMDALADGLRDHACWRDLAAEVEGSVGSEHPLSSIASEIRQLPQDAQRDLRQRGWNTFEAAARSYPALLTFRPGGPPVLPVLDLAATLSEPGGLGRAALRVVFSATDADHRTRSEWWDALVHGLAVWRRYSSLLDCPEDRKDLAMALVMQLLDDLGDDVQQVFWRTLQNPPNHLPAWDLPAEFGKPR